MAAQGSDVALLTKTYAGDLERCRHLCASVDRHMPDMRHYLVVDRVDRPLFARLATSNRVILESEDYLPELLQTTVFGRRLWLTPYGPPVRGWIQQQLAKLAVVAALDEPAVVLVDSDLLFVRPLAPKEVFREGRTRLYRAPGQGRLPGHMRWHRTAAVLLGLPPREYFGADYIGQAVTWRPEVVRAMLSRIRRSARMPWRMALSWRFRFAEYILYGVYVDHVEDAPRHLVFHDDQDLCHCSWHYDLAAPAGRQAFLEGVSPGHAAVLIQSNLNLSREEWRALAETFERTEPSGGSRA